MIGLGRMGPNMARRLMKGGHDSVVFDRTAETVEALTKAQSTRLRLKKHEVLLLDPVHTGRDAAGMIHLIRDGFFKKDETVQFLHTVLLQ